MLDCDSASRQIVYRGNITSHHRCHGAHEPDHDQSAPAGGQLTAASISPPKGPIQHWHHIPFYRLREWPQLLPNRVHSCRSCRSNAITGYCKLMSIRRPFSITYAAYDRRPGTTPVLKHSVMNLDIFEATCNPPSKYERGSIYRSYHRVGWSA